MSIREFIRTNRQAIDAHIRAVLKRPNRPINDADREEWIMNDEGLYRWALSEGVNL